MELCAVYSQGNELFNDLSLQDRQKLQHIVVFGDSSFRAELINYALYSVFESPPVEERTRIY